MTDRPFTRSPSEFQRIAEETSYHEACQKVRDLRATVSDIRRPKSIREAALRELRPLERELGLYETCPNGYNKP